MCGVFGVFGFKDAAALTALGLHALQHRGQESAGIASFDRGKFYSERRMGLVSEHFSKQSTIDKLPGITAMGHVRYSTSGETALRNVQPLYAELNTGGFAIAHNGNLTNAVTLRTQLIEQGAIFQSTSDTEVILHLVSKSRKDRLVDRFTEALNKIEGGFSLVAITNKKLIGARDPNGIRPLVLGKLNDGWILASETCALDIIGAEFVRDIENGEMVVITDKGVQSYRPFERTKSRPCVFEYVYFARPDSIVNGKSVYEVRKAFGRELAKENRIEADVIIPVPDSGVPAALGYAQQSGIPFELGIVRNHYVGRTFIQPTQVVREVGVRMKHSINRAVVAGKRVVLVDDSIVRGTTSVKIVKMFRDAGAKEVHMLISSPPIRYPDYYGIDTPKKENLLAATKTLEEMCKYIGCDSLSFLTIDGLHKAFGYVERDNFHPQFTDHCFTGDYPTQLTDLKERENR
jgi:amidophosphoribosyltransferase